MQVITRYNKPQKGKVTVSIENRRNITGLLPNEWRAWAVYRTRLGGIDVYEEEIFPITETAAITDCQNKFYQQMSERIEAGRRNLNHLPAAIKRTGNKRKD